MPGPPPKPLELKRRLGNPGKQKLPAETSTASLAPASSVPRPPKSLGKVGRTTWKRLWTAGWIWLSPKTDYDVMTRLCEEHDARDQLRTIIAKEGRILETNSGQPYTHPAVWQLSAVDKAITKYESLCGFTPADRTRLGLAEVKRQSRLQEFLASQGTG